MYRPSLRPGEELVKTSPGVTVKNVAFDAFLTSKRIIFVKKTDDFQERKELVFPLNLVKEYIASSDESGTPDIRFSIEKPSGEVGDLILRFIQTGDYRYAERDDWIENLKSLSRGVVPGHGGGAGNAFAGDTFSPGVPSGAAFSRDSDIYGIQPQDTHVPPAGTFRQPPAEDPYSRQQGFSQPPVSPQAPPPFPGEQPPRASAPAAPPPGPAPDAPSTMFCRFCGAKVPSGSVFCPSCGGKLGGQQEMRQPPVSQPPPRMPPENRQPVSPPPPPVQQGGGFVAPPPPPPVQQGGYGQQPGYPPRDGGISLADDRGYGYDTGRQAPPVNRKAMMKGQAKAEKARMKEQARAEKEQRKAMKKARKGGYGGYDDPYGYKESRMPEPKIIIMIIAVIAVIAVGGYAFTSGMIGGGTTASPGSSQSSTTAAATAVPGSTTVSETYGKWYASIFYPGEWSGSYTVNGITTTLLDPYDEPEIYGSMPYIYPKDFSGTIEITATILDGGAGGPLEIYFYNDKNEEVDKEISSGSSNTVTLTYP